MAKNTTEAAQPAADKTAPDKPAADKSVTSTLEARRHELRGEMVGLCLLFAGIAFGAALVTFSPHDMDVIQSGRSATDGVQNLIGPVGARIADLLLQLVGIGAFLLDGLLLVLAVRTLCGWNSAPRLRTALGIGGVVLSALILVHLGAQAQGLRPFGKDAAGMIPGAVAVLCKALLSTVGTTLLALWMLVISVAAILGRSIARGVMRWATGQAGKAVSQAATSGASVARSGMQSLKENLVPGRLKLRTQAAVDFESADEEMVQFTVAELEQRWNDTPPPVPSETAAPSMLRPSLPETAVVRVVGAGAALEDEFPRGETMAPRSDAIPTSVRRAREQRPDDALPTEAISVRVRLPVDAAPLEPDCRVTAPFAISLAPESSHTAQTAAVDMERIHQDLASIDPFAVAAEEPETDALLETAEAKAPGEPHEWPPAGNTGKGPRIIETEALRNTPIRVPVEAVQGNLAIGPKKWILPPSTLVQEPPARIINCDATALRENATVLEQKLADFNIFGEVTDIRPGPVVTTYEYRPAPGIKISKIVNLRDDLTMSLSALNVRVVAPIPGRDVVGIEVPNNQRQIVYFRELVDSPVFRESASLLTLILGKDIEGRPICTDLARAPHLLVAGATGTGKSVGINSFICSMLFRAPPDEVKFIFIDPKILELSVYDGIPHLLLPVLDEPRKAELALKWAVTEMDRRYRMLAAVEVRNLAGYKQKLPELRAAAQRKKALAMRLDSEGQTAPDIVEMPEDPPYIVVVIDEFADLIMAAGKEVEYAVARLAQKARAAGIHVILATQRPSVDVITGMIKANFPTRISFQVSSAIDSKVVLNSTGAETLLGMGDLLFLPPGEGHLRRAHGTWIKDDEVVALAKHWKDQGSPSYNMDILKDPEAEARADGDEAGEQDPLYDEAVQVVVDANQASVSFLQRKLGIGYGRSARIVDAMESAGVVGPSRGPNKPREILANHL